MAAEIEPPWSSDPNLGDDRADVKSLLNRYQVLFRKLVVPGAVDASDNINKLLNGFGNAQLNALGSLFYLLERALFESPSTVFDGQDGRQRYLIEYVPGRQVRDLKSYTHTNLSDESPVPFPGRDAVLAFFVEWIQALIIVVRLSPEEMALAGVDDHFIADTPSESVALKQWHAQLTEALSSFQN